MNRTAFGVVLVGIVLLASVAPVTATTGSTPAATDGPGRAQTGTQACSFPVSVTDGTGSNVTVDSEPKRVVVLGASAAQIMWEIGAKSKVVGMPVDSTTAYLNGSKSRTNTFQSDGYTVATERVVGLNPDLVIAPSIIPNSTVKTLRRAGVTVYKSKFGESFGDIYADTELTGRLVGSCGGANTTVTAMRTRIGAVRQAVGNDSTPSALYLLGGGYVAGNGTFIGDVVETAGGSNLAASAGIQGYKEISPETVASRNPAWIVTSNRSSIPDGAAYAGTDAVERNHTVVVDENYISQPGPRVVVPLTKIARRLHPDAMASANLTNTSTDAAGSVVGNVTTTGNASRAATATTGGTASTETASSPGTAMTNTPPTTATTASGESGTAGRTGSTDTTNGTAGTSSSNGDGFGVTVAAVALCGAALLARRRQ